MLGLRALQSRRGLAESIDIGSNPPFRGTTGIHCTRTDVRLVHSSNEAVRHICATICIPIADWDYTLFHLESWSGGVESTHPHKIDDSNGDKSRGQDVCVCTLRRNRHIHSVGNQGSECFYLRTKIAISWSPMGPGWSPISSNRAIAASSQRR